KQFKERALQAASTLVEAQLHDLETTSQGVSVKGAQGRRNSWRELAQAAQEIDPPLDVTVYFEPENQTWPVGALALTLEVDVDTGSISLNRAVFVHDCGTLVNPRLVEGQVVGGLIQGLADSLWERVEYGEDGQLR